MESIQDSKTFNLILIFCEPHPQAIPTMVATTDCITTMATMDTTSKAGLSTTTKKQKRKKNLFQPQ